MCGTKLVHEYNKHTEPLEKRAMIKDYLYPIQAFCRCQVSARFLEHFIRAIVLVIEGCQAFFKFFVVVE